MRARSSPSSEPGRRAGEGRALGGSRAQVREIDAWWREHRRAAPDLFTDELDRALLALEQTPGMGIRYEPAPTFRRLLLQRTGYHVYAREDRDRVYVVAVWSAYRGRGPRL